MRLHVTQRQTERLVRLHRVIRGDRYRKRLRFARRADKVQRAGRCRVVVAGRGGRGVRAVGCREVYRQATLNRIREGHREGHVPVVLRLAHVLHGQCRLVVVLDRADPLSVGDHQLRGVGGSTNLGVRQVYLERLVALHQQIVSHVDGDRLRQRAARRKRHCLTGNVRVVRAAARGRRRIGVHHHGHVFFHRVGKRYREVERRRVGRQAAFAQCHVVDCERYCGLGLRHFGGIILAANGDRDRALPNTLKPMGQGVDIGGEGSAFNLQRVPTVFPLAPTRKGDPDVIFLTADVECVCDAVVGKHSGG